VSRDADFPLVDDLLWRARNGVEAAPGGLTITARHRIGPVVELWNARVEQPGAYKSVSCNGEFFDAVSAAKKHGDAIGLRRGARFGVFPLRLQTVNGDEALWDLWRVRFQQAAEEAGFAKKDAQALVGALGELVDNIHVHSGAALTGLVAFNSAADMVELVVSDSGLGVLATLRRNPSFADLTDAGHALQLAAKDGVSSLAETGRGFGIGQLFRALVGHSGEVRLRSDDHSLTIQGNLLNLEGAVEAAQKARISGLTVSVLCAPA
jgi:anti-sigma regulatory factor (Ser/Thr protein kinase)